MSTSEPSPTVLYGDGRTMTLPMGWEPVEEQMFGMTLAQTEKAFTGGADSVDHAVEHLVRYYDPAGGYAGATFLDVADYDDYAITAADLWAVTTLSMDVPPEAGRALMNPGPPALRGMPMVTVPHRSYFLLSGTLTDFADWVSPRMVGMTPGDLPPPAFSWPADHAWCIALDVDPHYAGIGAAPEAIAQLVAHPGLDVVSADPTERQPSYYSQ